MRAHARAASGRLENNPEEQVLSVSHWIFNKPPCNCSILLTNIRLLPAIAWISAFITFAPMDNLNQAQDMRSRGAKGGKAAAAAAKLRPRAQRVRANIEPMATDVNGLMTALQCGKTMAKQLLTSGAIPSVKLGSRRIIPLAGIQRFLERKS
jgi:hypothetical protein